jgi:hypothetical protein
VTPDSGGFRKASGDWTEWSNPGHGMETSPVNCSDGRNRRSDCQWAKRAVS